jgi:DNA-binding transcriptional LysR family regulator
MRKYFDPVSLRLFVAVCEERNIARAAEREAIVPSAISKRIAAIEEEIGAPLLARGRRGIEPTAAGQALLTQARDILATMERLHSELSEFATGVRGRVRVFASISVLAEFLPDDVGSFLVKHQAVRVSLEERVSTEIVRGVREGAADFGVCWDASDLSGLLLVGYRSDHLSVVVPRTHPLASRKRLTFEDTLDYPQVDVQPGSSMQAMLRRYAAMAGKSLNHRIQVSTFEAASRSVAANLGIAILPRESAEAHAKALGLRVQPLADDWAKRRFVIGMRSRDALSPAARMLVDHLHQRSKVENG